MMNHSTTKLNVFKKPADYISCRQILLLMITLGFMLNYMLRANISFAIVEMVEDGGAINATLNASNKFRWNVYQKNQILGSFFWGYILTQLLGGRLAEIIGTRIVLGGGMVIASILTLLTPVTCQGGFIAVSILRAVTGFFIGGLYPATLPISVTWIPPSQRSKFLACMMASSLGVAITMPMCGFLIRMYGWESVFYITGGISLMWSIAWFFLVYDSPAQHPRISQQECESIESEIIIKHEFNKKPNKVPWLAIITSLPVWVNVFSVGVGGFILHTMMNQLPTYMKEVLHYDITSNGILSSLPFLGRYVMALSSGFTADSLLKSKKLSTLTLRKLYTMIAIVVPGLLMGLQSLIGYIPAVSVTICTAIVLLSGAASGGYMANVLDIAPNFSGTILGIGNTFATLGGWLSTFIVAAITSNNNGFSQWQYIFWILCSFQITSGLTFLFFASATVQPWNTEENNVKLDHKFKKLNREENDVKE